MLVVRFSLTTGLKRVPHDHFIQRNAKRSVGLRRDLLTAPVRVKCGQRPITIGCRVAVR